MAGIEGFKRTGLSGWRGEPWWLAHAMSLVVHAALVGGLWMAGRPTFSGRHISVEITLGESAALAQQAGFKSAPSPQWRETDVEELPEPPSVATRAGLPDVLVPPSAREVAKEELATVGVVSPGRARRASQLVDADISPREMADRSRRLPPSPASLAGNISIVQDRGVRRTPVPAKKHVPPLEYPAEAVRRGLEGRVEVLVKVNAEGRVVKATVYRSSGHELLDDAAVQWVRRWEFDGTDEVFRGRPHLEFRVPVRFDILSEER